MKRRKTEVDEVAGVRITHPDRVLFPGQGVRKRELIEHYLAVAKWMLPHIAGRPLALVRCPGGSGKPCFFQKHASPGWPDAFERIRIREKSGSGEYLHIRHVAGLVAAAQMDVLELHIWGSRIDRLEQPDRLVFDIDPAPGLAFGKVREAARELRDRLDQIGLESFALATGGKGIHVLVPLARRHGWDEHRNFAETMVRRMAADSPERYTASLAKAKRRGKIFIDFLRNQRGATAIAPLSSRARKNAYVALPVSWTTLTQLNSAQAATIREVARFLRRDPWPGYFELRQKLPTMQSRA